jgi:predicted PurR-regulated permease PerM
MRYHFAGKDDFYLKFLYYLVFTSFVLYFGKDLLVPISFAFLISFLLYPICVWFERKGVPSALAIFLSMLLLAIVVTAIIALLIIQFHSFLTTWPSIKPKLLESVAQISQVIMDNYSVTKEQQARWLTDTLNQSSNNLINYFLRVLYSSTLLLTVLILVPIFSMLILYHRRMLVEVSYRLFPNEKKSDLRNIILLTVTAYYNFIKGMIIVYAIVGVLNSVGLMILGIPNAIFFGFVAAILTFIPYVGIIVGSLLPMGMAWITFNSIWYPVGVVLIFTFVQYLEANIIFPMAVSSRLNVNTLVTLIAIIAGGLLWGLSGMILFVPFLGILKLIVDQHPKMKMWSMLLGTEQK